MTWRRLYYLLQTVAWQYCFKTRWLLLNGAGRYFPLFFMVGLHIFDMIPTDHDLHRMIGCCQNISYYEYACISGSGVWNLLLFQIHQPFSVQAGQLCSEQSRSFLVTLDCCVPWTKERKWVYRCWQVERYISGLSMRQWENFKLKSISKYRRI